MPGARAQRGKVSPSGGAVVDRTVSTNASQVASLAVSTQTTQSTETRVAQSTNARFLHCFTASRAAQMGLSPPRRADTWCVASHVLAHSSSLQKPELLSTQNLNPPTVHQPQPGLERQPPQSLRWLSHSESEKEKGKIFL